jgi:hypothetical protein
MAGTQVECRWTGTGIVADLARFWTDECREGGNLIVYESAAHPRIDYKGNSRPAKKRAMSNPLLRPNDPRFQRLPIDDDAGKNRFGDDGQAQANAGNDPAAGSFASSTSGEQPYQPRYETTAKSRAKLLTTFAMIGLGGALVGVLGATGLVSTGWVFPLCGSVASGTAMFLGYGDLREMTLGARDGTGRGATSTAMWLGLAGLAGCLGLVATMIWLGLSVFPDI